jgi:hypothetical protein
MKPYTDMLAVLATADVVGPTGIQVSPFRPQVTIHAHCESEVRAWQAWWNDQGSAAWTPSDHTAGIITHHYLVGRWHDWTVELTYLTRTAGSDVYDREPPDGTPPPADVGGMAVGRAAR